MCLVNRKYLDRVVFKPLLYNPFFTVFLDETIPHLFKRWMLILDVVGPVTFKIEYRALAVCDNLSASLGVLQY